MVIFIVGSLPPWMGQGLAVESASDLWDWRIQRIENRAKMMKWAAVAAVAAAAVWGGWSYLKPEPQAAYITEAVRRGDISRTVSATGEISPSNLVSVGAQASGQIKKLYVKLGQQVKRAI